MFDINKLWYGKQSILSYLLLPFSFLYYLIISFRRFLYQSGIKKSIKLPVPVVVVGNITVGGTGKTPLVIWLVEALKKQGFKPGVISRGYKGKAKSWPQMVTPHSDPKQVGDEPVLIAKKTHSPVCVGPDRVEAGRRLLLEWGCDVVISDDGLQHYGLARDFEVVVLDADRQLGNGCLLPAGPLRELKSKLKKVDAVLYNGIDYTLKPTEIVQVLNPQKTVKKNELNASVHAVCAIGNPTRFLKTLDSMGIEARLHAYPDHHTYSQTDIDFDGVVIMTEKDAVKCEAICDERHYMLPVAAHFTSDRADWFLKSLLYIMK